MFLDLGVSNVSLLLGPQVKQFLCEYPEVMLRLSQCILLGGIITIEKSILFPRFETTQFSKSHTYMGLPLDFLFF